MHEGLIGSHVHIFKKRVKRIEIKYTDADNMIKKISLRIMREYFNKIIDFGGLK